MDERADAVTVRGEDDARLAVRRQEHPGAHVVLGGVGRQTCPEGVGGLGRHDGAVIGLGTFLVRCHLVHVGGVHAHSFQVLLRGWGQAPDSRDSGA